MKFHNRSLPSGLLVTLLSASAVGQELVQDLSPSDAVPNHRFGSSVALLGDLALVGCLGDPGGGAAYLFDTVTGQQLHKLEGLDTHPGNNFGRSVAASPAYLVVGAQLDDDNGVNAGSAYVFDTATGQQITKLLAADGGPFDFFGDSVAVGEGRVVVGSSGDDDLGIQAGAAYVFDAATGQQLMKLTGSDTAGNHQFGFDVAVSGDLALIGARGVSSGAGAAYLFDLETGQELDVFVASNGHSGAGFGYSVALDGELAVVGAVSADSPGAAGSGMAYVFDASTGQELQLLAAADAGAGQEFGIEVGVDAGVVVVGASRADAPGVPDAGAAYTFDAATGVQLSKLTSSTPANVEFFGWRVAISGENTLIGVQEHDGSIGANEGAAYVFRSPDATVHCVAAPNSAGAGAHMGVTGSASIARNDLVLHVTGAPARTFGIFYYGSVGVEVPFGNGFRCAGGTAQRLPLATADGTGVASHPFDNQASTSLVTAGTTWNFQYWYRDVAGGGALFNLSDGLAIDFRP